MRRMDGRFGSWEEVAASEEGLMRFVGKQRWKSFHMVLGIVFFFLTERLIKCIEQVTLASWLSLFDSMYRVPSSIHLFIYLLCKWFYLHHASFFPGILNFLLCLVILG